MNMNKYKEIKELLDTRAAFLSSEYAVRFEDKEYVRICVGENPNGTYNSRIVEIIEWDWKNGLIVCRMIEGINHYEVGIFKGTTRYRLVK